MNTTLESLILGKEVIQALTLGMTVLIASFARMFGLTFIFPLFSWANISGPIRISFALATALPISFFHYTSMSKTGVSLTLLEITLLISKEFCLGAFLGGLLGVPFWGAQSAGDFIDHERGASIANIVDPLHASHSTVLGAIFVQLALAIYILNGGFLATIKTVYGSYEVWPIFAPFPNFTLESANIFGEMINLLFQIMINFAAPLLLIMIFIDLWEFFFTRAFEKMHIHSLNVGIKNMAVLFFLPVYVLFFTGYLNQDTSLKLSKLLQSFGLQ